MGDNLDFVDLGDNVTCTSTSMPSSGGGEHSIIVSDDLCPLPWGNNDYGQLGTGDDYFGENKGDDSGEMGDNLWCIDFDRDPTAMPTTDPSADPTIAPTTIESEPLFCLNTYHSCMAHGNE